MIHIPALARLPLCVPCCTVARTDVMTRTDVMAFLVWVQFAWAQSLSPPTPLHQRPGVMLSCTEKVLSEVA